MIVFLSSFYHKNICHRESEYVEKIGKINKINAKINYAGRYNITLNNEDKQELLAKSSAPYKLFISNKGKDNGLTKINFELS